MRMGTKDRELKELPEGAESASAADWSTHLVPPRRAAGADQKVDATPRRSRQDDQLNVYFAPTVKYRPIAPLKCSGL